MPQFQIVTPIRAPIERCFDLARDVGFHVQTMQHTRERVVAGRTSGLLQLGEIVTWEGRHFLIRQRLTAKITAMDAPNHFRDEMQRGAFAHLRHDHIFTTVDGLTHMTDHMDFASPLGPLGRLVDHFIMTAYLRRLMTRRAELIRDRAEANNAPPRFLKPRPTANSSV